MTTFESILMAVLAAQVIGGGYVGHRRYMRAKRLRQFTAKYKHRSGYLWTKGRRSGKTDHVDIEVYIVVRGTNDDLRKGMVQRAHRHPGIEEAIKDIVENELEFYLLKS